MSGKTTKRTKSIRQYLVDSVRFGNQDVVSTASDTFQISRQSIHRHLAVLVKEGRLIATGHTRARIYTLGPVRSHTKQYAVAGLAEDVVHRKDFSFVFDGLLGTVAEICHYGFTEMLNNAIDHSEGESISVQVSRDLDKVGIHISDDGEGIFKRIARLLDLPDPRESILELSKGKLTTDPENHTGQGIFFTSRSFDYFHIASGDLCFTHDNEIDDDFLMHWADDRFGTHVYMEIALDSDKDLGKVFDEFTSGPDEFHFARTLVPVKLALYEGESLVSRSQAKRILNRIERFKTVVLDFEGVDKIGQAFADEVFRVFASRHRDIELIPLNLAPGVELMIMRANADGFEFESSKSSPNP